MHWIKIKNQYLDLEKISRIIIQGDFISFTSREIFAVYTSRTDRKIMGERLTAEEFTALKVNLEMLLKDETVLL